MVVFVYLSGKERERERMGMRRVRQKRREREERGGVWHYGDVGVFYWLVSDVRTETNVRTSSFLLG